MLKLTTPCEEQQDEPATLLFPVDAIRRLTAGIVEAPAIPGRAAFRDPIRCVEEALERVESNFLRLRAQFEDGDDRPRAA
jgi:hypothetical protein